MEDRWERPVAIVGAGVMGRGIAYVAAASGAETRLVDVDADQLEQARVRIGRDLDEGVRRGKLTANEAEAALSRVATTTDVAAGCAGAGLVIEAVVESMAVKHEVLRTADATTPGDAIIATNTSALPVGDIVGVLRDPSRGLGMHFFNPVAAMRLCELVVAQTTSQETVEAAERAAHRMGKETVRVSDTPGFATSRLNALIGNEGFRMLEEGVASAEDIDIAARLGLNHPMGPLEMADLVGLDVRLAVLEHLHGTLGERFKPTDVHRRLVAQGRLGRKTAHGIYRYDEHGKRLPAPTDLP